MSACGGGGDGGAADAAPGTSTTDAGTRTFTINAEDFGCILDWPKVRRFRITNKLGRQEEALELARSNDGGRYPPGTVIQLVPSEAMVKHREGWNPETNNWEFFSLQVQSSGVTIEQRGTTDVENQFGGNCFACHSKAEPEWDFVCERDHGCDPLPLDAMTIRTLQGSDPRCGGS